MRLRTEIKCIFAARNYVEDSSANSSILCERIINRKCSYSLHAARLEYRAVSSVRWRAAWCAEKSVEHLSKLCVEDGINDRIESAVDVAEPDKARQHQRIDATERRGTVLSLIITSIVAYTHRVDDIDGEERQPTEQKHGCTHTDRHTHIHVQQNCSVLYCVLKSCTVISTLRWAVLTVL